MIEPKKLANGNLLVPMTAEADGIIGDGAAEIGPDHPMYDEWLAWLEKPPIRTSGPGVQ